MIWLAIAYVVIGIFTALSVLFERPWCGSEQDFENIYRRLDRVYDQGSRKWTRAYMTLLFLCMVFWWAIYALRIKDKWF